MIDNNILDGMMMCLSIIMLCVATIHLIKGSKELAVICALIATSNIYGNYSWFQSYFNESIIANILLAEYRVVLIPSLLYIFLLKKTKPLNLSIDLNYYKHLILPLLYIVSYMVLKFGFKNFNSFRSTIVLTYWTIYLLIITFYIYSIFKLTKKIKSKIVERIYKHYKRAVVVFSFYLSPIFIYIIFKIIFFVKGIEISSNVNFIIEIIEFPIQLSIILFSLLELEFLKKYFTIKDIQNPEFFIPREKEIELLINKIIEEKLFIDLSFDLRLFLENNGIQQKYFKNFISREYNQSPIVFLNRLRIEEFKFNLEKDNYKNYDLIGLAKECGFKSKATFFRVFKESEGITPNQYRLTIHNN